ncbi:type II secretion system protein [Coraliomargarita sp. SDUM461004]|uniref:Type II secretion system protein n=1 Tax=Thalassobacterium sedimentorum TaxID=3041258 RepID=A0ABU1ALI9_9BACT|nr:type II secretion system protein [Coraliomargarita sp. SDUM461004]MDQ8195577.1 type II secretion system protein [Coraliomargarita sp. SDUM461004]
MMNRSTSRAFTLIELLATVAITAILLSILLSAFGTVRSKVEIVKSVSNLRQVGMSILTYAGEHNNTLPNLTEAGKSNVVSKDLMDPYLDYDNEAWFCPIMEQVEVNATDAVRGRYKYSWRLTNFNDGWRDHVDAISLLNVVNPSEAMVAANLSAGMRGGYWDGHAHVLFADGSVRRVEDSSYLGGALSASEGVSRQYLQLQQGKLRGYDF